MKMKDKGFWVSHHFYWQSMAYYFFYSARFRSFTFFCACDPAIDMGGMLDENKTDIYNLLPEAFVPLTITCYKVITSREEISKSKITFPLIIKPNVGFRGYLVVKVDTYEELENFLKDQDLNREWLIQEFLDFKKEYSLLFYRQPNSGQRGITSLIEKIYPTIIGNGKDTLGQLIEKYNNPFLDKNTLEVKFQEKWNFVPSKEEKIVLDEIGNYSRGAKFYSLQDKIDHSLIEATEYFFKDVEGLDFFRMDFKADSLEEYKNGNFKILEINGAKSEPLHIYDPKYSFWENTKTNHHHWKIMKDIVKERKANKNYRFPSTLYGLKSLFAIKKLVK